MKMVNKMDKIKTLKDLSMSNYQISPHEYYKSSLDKLIEENKNLKSSLAKFSNFNYIKEENERLRQENYQLKNNNQQYEALLQLNVEYKEHIINQRLKINKLKEDLKELNETYNALFHRSQS